MGSVHGHPIDGQRPCRPLEVPCKGAEQGRLATAQRTEKADEFAQRCLEIDIAHRLKSSPPTAEPDRQAFGGNPARRTREIALMAVVNDGIVLLPTRRRIRNFGSPFVRSMLTA